MNFKFGGGMRSRLHNNGYNLITDEDNRLKIKTFQENIRPNVV